jgi:hypothetical protein
MTMQGYHDENYVENSKEILKSPKHGTQDIRMASPFAYLVAYLAHLHPTLSRQSHLLHNNKLLIEKIIIILMTEPTKINK